MDEATLRPIADFIFGVNFQSLVVVGSDQGSAVKLRDRTQVNYGRVPIRENDQIDMARFLGSLQAVGLDGLINVLEPLITDVGAEIIAREIGDGLRDMMDRL